jgi:hypothetical protein
LDECHGYKKPLPAFSQSCWSAERAPPYNDTAMMQ